MEDGVVDKIRAAGGEVYAVTSEPQYLADQAHEHWALNFENVGDPHHEISRVCNERGWLTLHTNDRIQAFLQRGADWKIEHPKGFFQPGILALSRERRVLYRWRSVPSVENQQGAVARPLPSYVWDQLERSLAVGAADHDAALDEDPAIDGAAPPRLLVLALLIANGWFLSARSMMYSPGKDMTGARALGLMARWVLFLGFWIAAFSLLPPLFAGIAFLGWGVWIVRDYKRFLSGFLSGKGAVGRSSESTQ